jgi:hypothetical protein
MSSASAVAAVPGREGVERLEGRPGSAARDGAVVEGDGRQCIPWTRKNSVTDGIETKARKNQFCSLLDLPVCFFLAIFLGVEHFRT